MLFFAQLQKTIYYTILFGLFVFLEYAKYEKYMEGCRRQQKKCVDLWFWLHNTLTHM